MAKAQDAKKEAEIRAKAASLNPNEMAEGGGLLNDIRATIVEAAFEMTDYGGKSKMKRPAAHLVLEESDGEKHEDQWWSCGKKDDWMPSEDGRFLIPIGKRTQIHRSSNFGMLTDSLLNAQFPEDKFDVDISFLVGLEAHWRQEQTGRDKKKSADGTTEYDDTALCVSEIFKFPWEKKSAAQNKGKAGGKAKAEAGGGEVNAEGEAVGLIMQIIQDNDGEITKNRLPAEIMTARKGEDDKVTNKIVGLVFDEGWIGSDKPWAYENGTLKLG